jgi:hypothetical protein
MKFYSYPRKFRFLYYSFQGLAWFFSLAQILALGWFHQGEIKIRIAALWAVAVWLLTRIALEGIKRQAKWGWILFSLVGFSWFSYTLFESVQISNFQMGLWSLVILSAWIFGGLGLWSCKSHPALFPKWQWFVGRPIPISGIHAEIQVDQGEFLPVKLLDLQPEGASFLIDAKHSEKIDMSKIAPRTELVCKILRREDAIRLPMKLISFRKPPQNALGVEFPKLDWVQKVRLNSWIKELTGENPIG